jgi:PAS domain S-box-containing protein
MGMTDEAEPAAPSLPTGVLSGEDPASLLAAIVSSSQDAIISRTLDGIITSWNGGAQHLYGYTAEEAIGQPIAMLIPPDHPDELPTIMDRLRRGERVETYRTERVTKDGQRLQVSVAVSPVADANGRLVGASAIARDVSDLVRLERDLQKSNDQRDAVLESASEGMLVLGPHGRIQYANRAAATMIGFDTIPDLLAATGSDFLQMFSVMYEDGTPIPPERMAGQRALRGERPPDMVERYRVIATGEERYSTVHARPVFGDDGEVRFAVLTIRDITEQHREHDRLQFLEEASAILASSLDYDLTLNRVAQIAVPRLADWAALELLDENGRLIQVGLAHIDPEQVRWARELTKRRPPDPNATTGSANVIRTGRAEFYPTLDRAQLEAQAQDDEMREILRRLHLSSALTVPMRARERTIGALTLVYGDSERHYSEADLRTAQDIADRAAMAVDNARLYRDAERALRLRDEFLSTASHDLRTPLTTVRGLTELLLRQLKRGNVPPDRLLRALKDVDRASRGMSRMIDELLDLSRVQSGRALTLKRERFDLAEMAQELIDEYQLVAVRHVLRLIVSVDNLYGYWDENRLERMLNNLLSNAVKYSPNGGTITMRLSSVAVGDGPPAWVELRVEDEGVGIPTTEIPHIFERHFRGSNVSRGMPGLGIGLAGVAQTIELHGGSVRVESEEGHGSAFIVRLPTGAPPAGTD